MSTASIVQNQTRLAAYDPSLERAAVLCVGIAMLGAACWRVVGSFGSMMWLDELYTTTLIGAPSLGHLWDGALRGVDGNPPLYLSLAWLMAAAVPADPERVLRAFNLIVLAATTALLYRIGRRVAAPLSVVAALAALPALDSMVEFALLEVRTYALYLFLVAATLHAALRVVDRASLGRTALLAGVGVMTTLAHSFAGFYVLATFGASGLVCIAAHDRRAAAALALAAIPTAITLAAWIVVAMPAQIAVATPYGWIPQPDMAVLLEALTGSPLLTPVLLIGLPWCAARAGFDRRAMLARRDVAALFAALAAYGALTVAGWLGSQVITPFFVPRYFIPNLLMTALSLISIAEIVRRGIRPAPAAAAALFCAVMGLATVAHGQPESDELIPCVGSDGHFLEEQASGSGLPVVAESPHAWLPRNRYAPGQVTLYPLDWRVVLDHPRLARNNAMDFHIMDILRSWAAPGSDLATHVLGTDDIIARHGRFLLLDEASRGWFDELRARTRLSAALIARGAGCRLWDVDLHPADGS